MPVCQKCSQSFPWVLKIDGKRRSLTSRKFCLDCSPYDSRNTKDLTKTVEVNTSNEKYCNRCKKIKSIKDFYIRYGADKKASGWCKECLNYRVLIKQRELKEQCIVYKGGKCQKCGYFKCNNALEFHHRDKNKKEFAISRYSKYSFEYVRTELDKCDLLCSNCHREAHFFDLPNNQQDIYISHIKRKALTEQDVSCMFCKRVFQSKRECAKFCNLKCSANYKQKTIRPSLEELESTIQKNGYSKVGREYGVSPTTIRRWLKSMLNEASII